PDGTITTIGGDGFPAVYLGFPRYTAQAVATEAGDSISPYDLAEHPDGSVWALEHSRGVVRRYGLDGTVTTVAGVFCWPTCPAGEELYGIPAISAKLGRPEHIAIGVDGSAYLTDNFRSRVMRVNTPGILELVAKGSNISAG